MKRYEIIIEQTIDSATTPGVRIKRINNGFTAIELLGYLELIRSEILEIIQGNESIKVEEIIRQAGEEL